MSMLLRTVVVWSVSLVAATCWGAPTVEPGNSPVEHRASYIWRTVPAGDAAELVTLFCRGCEGPLSKTDVPLISVLRDTLGDGSSENDRLTYLWLLGFQQPNAGRRLLSAVPFFYWKVGNGSAHVSDHDTAPLLDLTAPEHPVVTSLGREILQRALLDGMMTPIRASSHAYRTNELDHERLHLEEAISYLREATPTEDSSGLNKNELSTVIARLELRKTLLGGLVKDRQAASFGKEASFNYERVRARNWELLRQWADKTGLYFEPLNLAGTANEYATLWFAPDVSTPPEGSQLGPIWKLLNIKDPWGDPRLKNWTGIAREQWLDERQGIVPAHTSGAHLTRMIPLGVYGLNYPQQPLLLVDFRNMLHVRQHEMTQRTITELTSGVIGISHFTNWYYFAGAAIYDFIAARHGAAMNQSERLDSYSQFRVRLALDQDIDPGLRRELQRRVDSLAVNPLEVSPAREIEAASLRYEALEREADDKGLLLTRLDKSRRKELALAAETGKQRVRDAILHDVTFGAYTHRVNVDSENIAKLRDYRRLQYQLDLLDGLTAEGTPPEVAYDVQRIRASVSEVKSLLPLTASLPLHTRASATLSRLQELTRDASVEADCSATVAMIEKDAASHSPGIAAQPAVVQSALRKAPKAVADPLE